MEDNYSVIDKSVFYIRKYWSIKKIFPTNEWLMKKLNVSHVKMIGILVALEELELIERKNKQRYVTEKLLNYELGKKKENNNTIKVKNGNIQIFIIRIVMAIVGVGAAFMSIYFSVTWLMEYLHPFFAIILGVIMVLFSVAAFETILIFVNNKQFGFVPIFVVLWIIVLIFSMISTIGVLFNNQIILEENEQKQNNEVIYKTFELESYNKMEQELEKFIIDKETELKAVNNLLLQFTDLKTRELMEKEWISGLITKRKAEEKINSYRVELKEIRNKKMNFLKKNQEKTYNIIEETQEKSFYVWLGGVFNTSVRFIKFFLYVFPAIFIDIISPLAIGVAMFLRRKKR